MRRSSAARMQRDERYAPYIPRLLRRRARPLTAKFDEDFAILAAPPAPFGPPPCPSRPNPLCLPPTSPPPLAMRRLYRHTSTLSLSYAVPIFHLARSATQTSLLPSKAALAAPPAAPAAAPAAPLPALPKHPLVGVHNFRDVGTSVYVSVLSLLFSLQCYRLFPRWHAPCRRSRSM